MDPRLPVHGHLVLAPTLGALEDPPRAALDRLSEEGFRFVQLSAAQPEMRPRDLDRSARRDLRGRLRRLDMSVAGVDLWIPPAHFTRPDTVDRAVAATHAAVELAADLGRCPVSLILPCDDEDDDATAPVIEALTNHALRFGVPLADHAVPPRGRQDVGVGIDPPAWLGQSLDPAEAVTKWADRLLSARVCDLLTSGVRAPVGEPDGARLDVAEYHGRLAASGYVRPLIVDMRQWPDPWRGLEQTKRVLSLEQ